MLTCSSCGGFVPEARSACPNCDTQVPSLTAVWARRLGRATLIACTSVTLSACYGGVADGPWDDSYWDAGGHGGEAGGGAGGAGGGAPVKSCAATARIDVDAPPARVDLTLNPTSVFDDGACSLDAGVGTGLQFHAHETGVHRFTVEADFDVSLSTFAVDGNNCDRPLLCEVASTVDGAGGEGGTAGSGSSSTQSATVELGLVDGDVVALFVSADTEIDPLPTVVLRIDTP